MTNFLYLNCINQRCVGICKYNRCIQAFAPIGCVCVCVWVNWNRVHGCSDQALYFHNIFLLAVHYSIVIDVRIKNNESFRQNSQFVVVVVVVVDVIVICCCFSTCNDCWFMILSSGLLLTFVTISSGCVVAIAFDGAKIANRTIILDLISYFENILHMKRNVCLCECFFFLKKSLNMYVCVCVILFYLMSEWINAWVYA